MARYGRTLIAPAMATAALLVPLHAAQAGVPIVSVAQSASALNGWVHDSAQVIAPDQQAAMDNVLARLEQDVGVQFVIVAAQDLQGQTIDAYAVTKGREWRVGQRTHGAGLMLVVVPDQRQARIEVSDSLKPILTEEFCARVVQLMVPSFKEGRYADGLVIGMVSVDTRLRKVAAEMAG